MESTEESDKDPESKTVKVNLVGLKRMKVNHVWRLEFDVYEEDGSKVKGLIDQVDKDFYLLLVPIDKGSNNS